MKKNAGNVMADLLVGYGVKAVFGIPGGQTLPLYYGIEDNAPKIKHVLMREESNAVYAADAYARVGGGLGVCDATAGCGAIRFTPGLAESYNSSVPVLAISSEMNHDWVAVKHRGCGAQQADIESIVAPVTKWTACLPETNSVAEMTNRAVQMAMTGRPGPVYVEIPFDLFWKEYTGPAYQADPNLVELPAFRSTADMGSVLEAIKVLKQAKKPIMVVGGGAWLSGAKAEITELAEKLDIPVATSLSGKGALDETHPLSIGVMGSLGSNSVANAMVMEADVVFAIGYKFSQNSTFYWKFPTAEQKVIHLDVDDSEFGKTYALTVGLLGDAKATLRLMLDELKEESAKNNPWRARMEGLRMDWAKEKAHETREETPILPQQVVAVLNDICDDNTILACDASFACGWAGTFFDVYGNRRAIFPRGMSGLGYGLPAGIGAAVARPDSTVVVLAGDGGFSYSIGELATLAEQGLNVKVVLLNNKTLGWIKWYEAYFFNGRFAEADTHHIDFAQVAEGMGVQSFHFEDPATLKEDLKKALAAEGPALIDITTTETEACKYTENKAAVEAIHADHERLNG